MATLLLTEARINPMNRKCFIRLPKMNLLLFLMTLYCLQNFLSDLKEMGNVIAKYRATAGRLLLILLTGYAVLNLLWQQIHLYPGMSEPDPVTIHEARISQLRPLLPPSGPVGYVTTVENGGIFAAEKTFTNADVPLAFFLLATLVLLFLPARSPETAASAGDRPGPRSAQPKTRPTKGNKPKRIQEPK